LTAGRRRAPTGWAGWTKAAFSGDEAGCRSRGL